MLLVPWNVEPRTTVREAVSCRSVHPARSLCPRYDPNSRPSRRTRTCVRPGSTLESPIEPWFASYDLTIRSIKSGRYRLPTRGALTMATNKTASPVTAHSDPPDHPTKGLSATSITAAHSAQAEPCLDTLFHRTDLHLSCAGKQHMCKRRSRLHSPKTPVTASNAC